MINRIRLLSLIAPVALAAGTLALLSTGGARAEVASPEASTPRVDEVGATPLMHGTVYNEGLYCVAFCNDGTRINFNSPPGIPWTTATCSTQASGACQHHGGVSSSQVSNQR